MREKDRYPPDTAWLPRGTMKRMAPWILILILFLITIRVVDHRFLDDSLYNFVRLIWYELTGQRWY